MLDCILFLRIRVHLQHLSHVVVKLSLACSNKPINLSLACSNKPRPSGGTPPQTFTTDSLLYYTIHLKHLSHVVINVSHPEAFLRKRLRGTPTVSTSNFNTRLALLHVLRHALNIPYLSNCFTLLHAFFCLFFYLRSHANRRAFIRRCPRLCESVLYRCDVGS